MSDILKIMGFSKEREEDSNIKDDVKCCAHCFKVLLDKEALKCEHCGKLI